LGVALLVGGNIAGLTDNLTTSISTYTQRGGSELALAIALAIILLIIVFGINLILLIVQRLRK
jgi:ABC-type tungstate transport system substrate-binding protein